MCSYNYFTTQFKVKLNFVLFLVLTTIVWDHILLIKDMSEQGNQFHNK